MAYRKRRYNRRYKNKTKKFNKYAYAKTDSKNQSKQIVRLNKKINNVYKTLKPEIIRINASAGLDVSESSPVIIPFTTFISSSSVIDKFKGNFAKFIYFNYRLYVNPGAADLTSGKSIRVVILQNKYPLAAAPTAAELFNISSTSYGVFSPFKDDIHLKYKILLSKVSIISSDRDMLYRSYIFKKLINYKKTTGDTSTYPRGCIFVCVFAPYNQASLNFAWTSKFGYVDTIN